MPELPEVETIKRQLDKNIVGNKILSVEIRNPKSFTGNPDKIISHKIIGTRRIGKMLVCELGDDLAIGIHLKMSGQLILLESRIQYLESSINQKHIRVVIKFTNKDELLFIDQRKFGWVKVMTNQELKSMNYVKNLGSEPWDITEKEFASKLRKKSKAIKVVLTDQDVVSGVGNIYANDALWMAGIKPQKSAKSLSHKEVGILRESLIKVLDEGIRNGGSTGHDGKYIHINGESGKYQNYFKVYDQAGKLCQRGDGGIIVKIKLGGRGTYYCPNCQM
jgi:formamidopyrimidine-DNA glycosylase